MAGATSSQTHELRSLRREVVSLRAENAELRAENAELRAENAELRAENALLRTQVEELQTLVAQLTATVNVLTSRLEQNSSNSHKSPSSDTPSARKSRQKQASKGRKRSGKKQGGQPGHEGKTRELIPPEEVDETILCVPTECKGCGQKLPAPVDEPERMQVSELLDVLIKVTDYLRHSVACPCCDTVNVGVVPDGADLSPFGPRLQATIAYLVGAFRVSRRNVQELVGSILGVSVSLGAISNIERRVSESLAAPVDEAMRFVRDAAAVNVDETGFFENNRKNWLWGAVAGGAVSIFLIRATRGMKVAREILGAAFSGILISDRAKCYLLIDMKHRQICWAHLKREFQKLVDSGLPGAEIGQHLQDDRKQLFEWWHRVRDGTMSRSTFRRKVGKLRSAVRELLEQHPLYEDDDPGCAAFLRELLRYEDAMWTFTRVEGVEPTNNEAERAVRPGVIWRKISFGTQSARGSRFVERMLTTVGSLRRQQRDVLQFVTAAYRARVTGQPAPSLLPR